MDQPSNQPTPARSRRPTLHTSDLDLFDTITAELGMTGTAAQRFHALITWVQQQQEALQPSEPTAPPALLPVVNDQARVLGWFTDEITSLRQQLSEAHQQLASAQEEITTLRQQPAITQQDSEAGRAWRSERSIMQAKIDSLAGENQSLRRRLERFDSLRQVLMGDNEPQSHTTSPEASQTSPEAPGATEESDSTIAQRRPHSAQERAAHIWQVLQDWNNSPSRPHSEKVAISATTLERRFGIYRPAAQQFIADHQAEIEQHAQAHAITAPTHNRGVPDQVWEILKQQSAEIDT
jgi:hypothetical protein